ncbi:MAG: winged helix-turn-helix domain-containing protein [Rhizobiaceae bacterium]
MTRPVSISNRQARAIWLRAQRLDETNPFGHGPEAVLRAVTQLGYVQIDTINVVERCHHHILLSRIPAYRRGDLVCAQSRDKSVFEYWTHALSYIPTSDMRYFLPAMKAHRADSDNWFSSVAPSRMRRVMAEVRKRGPLSIRDIEDKRLVAKSHEWASKKPSKKALEKGFFDGRLAIAERSGIIKSYELMERHFGWDKPPRPATGRQITAYLLDRALRSQGFVSLDSICHLNAPAKKAILELIERRVKARKLKPVLIEEDDTQYWAEPENLDERLSPDGELTHILSPFDPLIIQRKRTSAIFGYDHIFEAYVPEEKRRFGYFALPVLVGDEIVAALDLKADRQAGELKIKQWNWIGNYRSTDIQQRIEAELDRFEKFQLAVE